MAASDWRSEDLRRVGWGDWAGESGGREMRRRRRSGRMVWVVGDSKDYAGEGWGGFVGRGRKGERRQEKKQQVPSPE
jgi:hypothetical protein